MSASTPVNVTIIGATGRSAGAAIANSFVQPEYKGKINLTLLVRKETAETPGPKKDALDVLVTAGAKIVHAHLDQSEDELAAALKGANVVISGVDGFALARQIPLIAAAKAAGVGWFIPSGYDYDYTAFSPDCKDAVPYYPLKFAALDAIQAAGMAYTITTTGIFYPFALSPFLGFDFANNTVTASGSFDQKLNVSSLDDLGATLADAILTGKGRNANIYLGEPVSWDQMTDALEAATGKKFKRVVQSVADAEAASKTLPVPLNFFARFSILVQTQKNGISWPKEQSYAVKNGIKHQTFAEYVKANFKKE